MRVAAHATSVTASTKRRQIEALRPRGTPREYLAPSLPRRVVVTRTIVSIPSPRDAQRELGLLPVERLQDAPERIRQRIGNPCCLQVVRAEHVEHLRNHLDAAVAAEGNRLARAQVEAVVPVVVDL